MASDPDVYIGLAHVTVPVRDLEIAERFYVEVLGGKLVARIDADALRKRHPGHPVNPHSIHLGILFGSAEIDLFVQEDGQADPRLAHPHIALAVHPEALDRLRERLRRYNVTAQGPNRRGPPGHASVYFNDPFGNHLEFLTVGYRGEAPFIPPRMAELAYSWTPPAEPVPD